MTPNMTPKTTSGPRAARSAVKQAVKREHGVSDAARAVPFARLCRAAGLPEPIAEHRFAPPRRWRFDWCWPDHGVALEVEGGVWTNGRHTRGSGFLRDVEKYNTAAAHGWLVLRCTPGTLCTDATLAFVRQALTCAREAA